MESLGKIGKICFSKTPDLLHPKHRLKSRPFRIPPGIKSSIESLLSPRSAYIYRSKNDYYVRLTNRETRVLLVKSMASKDSVKTMMYSLFADHPFTFKVKSVEKEAVLGLLNESTKELPASGNSETLYLTARQIHKLLAIISNPSLLLTNELISFLKRYFPDFLKDIYEKDTTQIPVELSASGSAHRELETPKKTTPRYDPNAYYTLNASMEHFIKGQTMTVKFPPFIPMCLSQAGVSDVVLPTSRTSMSQQNTVKPLTKQSLTKHRDACNRENPPQLNENLFRYFNSLPYSAIIPV